MKQQNFAAVTIVARNYVGMALTMAQSFKKHHTDLPIFIYVLDDETRDAQSRIQSTGVTFLGPQDVPIAGLKELLFRYDVTEASTAVKPNVLKHIVDRGFDGVIYLDPDLYCLGHMTEMLALLSASQMVLTPHVVTPVKSGLALPESLLLQVGAYNLGFLALRSSIASEFCLWWQAKLQTECLYDLQNGFYYDQKWMDLAPSLFDGVAILKHRGYNVAWWNLQERTLTRTCGTLDTEIQAGLTPELVIEETGEAVKFFHFSALPNSMDDRISRNVPQDRMSPMYKVNSNAAVANLVGEYRQALSLNGHENFKKTPYRYDFFADGKPISKADRIVFRQMSNGERQADPFQKSSQFEALRIAPTIRDSKSGSLSQEETQFILDAIVQKQPDEVIDLATVGGFPVSPILSALRELDRSHPYTSGAARLLVSYERYRNSKLAPNKMRGMSSREQGPIHTGNIIRRNIYAIDDIKRFHAPRSIEFAIVTTRNRHPAAIFDLLLLVDFLADDALVIFHNVDPDKPAIELSRKGDNHLFSALMNDSKNPLRICGSLSSWQFAGDRKRIKKNLGALAMSTEWEGCPSLSYFLSVTKAYPRFRFAFKFLRSSASKNLARLSPKSATKNVISC